MHKRSIIYLSARDESGRARYVPALTGLRAVAASLVFLHHYNPAMSGNFTNRLFAQGYVGVSVFFVLSGFLIYHRYADAYFKQSTWSWRTYLQNRFARIFPLYTLILIGTVSFNTITGKSMNWLLLGLNLTLWKGFFDDYKFSGIAQSWSLTVEECFYLAAPLLFTLLRRWGASILLIGLVGVGLFLWATLGQIAWHGLFTSLPFLFFYTFFGRAFEFIVGMWLARRWHQNQLPGGRYDTLWGLLLIVTCVLCQACLSTFTTSSCGLFWGEVIMYNCILPIGIGLFLLSLIRRKSTIGKILSQPVMLRLGQSSYAFYLIHIGLVANGLHKIGITTHWLLFGILVLIAYGLYNYVEKPIQKWLRIK